MSAAPFSVMSSSIGSGSATTRTQISVSSRMLAPEMHAAMSQDLLEREAERERVQELLPSAATGNGRELLAEGEAGIGKTALLDEVRRQASDADFEVLSARGGALERDFAHGVSRQLYEPVLHRATAARRRKLLKGAAARAAPVLGLAEVEDLAEPRLPGDAAMAANHGLYWLTAQLAEQRPLLILVDDAHWVDSATLLFLSYLGRRVDELPVLIALGLRPAEPGAPRELLEAIRALAEAETLSLRPLSDEGTATMVQRVLGTAGDAAFHAACHEAARGNPFLLGELLRGLAAEGAEPDSRYAERARRLAPSSIRSAVLGRLGTMAPEALELARMVAVLGKDAELRHAAELADLSSSVAQRAADALAGAYIFAPGRPLRFAHPIVREAVYEDLPEASRLETHARAARLIDAEGADPDRAALHLLASEPLGNPWVVEQLRAAADRALRRGSPDAAVTLLRRALAEPPASSDERATVLLELGRVERFATASAATEHLSEALPLLSDPSSRTLAARELASAHLLRNDVEGAVATLEQRLAAAQAEDPDGALVLRADLVMASQLSDAQARYSVDEIETLASGLPGQTKAERALLAGVAYGRMMRGAGPASEIAELAGRALPGAGFNDDDPVVPMHSALAMLALIWTDHQDAVAEPMSAAVADARAHGSPVQYAAGDTMLARVAVTTGDLEQAEAHARHALGSEVGPFFTEFALTSLIFALLERGEPEEAEQILARHGLEARAPSPTVNGRVLLSLRSTLRAGQGRIDEAVADAAVALRSERERGGRHPTRGYSFSAALIYRTAGKVDDARRVALDDLEIARSFGLPSAEGIALVILALVETTEQAIPLLEQGVQRLRGSPRKLEYAHALVELGSALRRAKRRADSREYLAEGATVAHACGALPLAERANEELKATGARPRGLMLTGIEALTPSERRVARMAAKGMTNPEIAQALFVTRKTVETHLGHVYSKLDIGSRGELGSAFEKGAPETEAASGSAP